MTRPKLTAPLIGPALPPNDQEIAELAEELGISPEKVREVEKRIDAASLIGGELIAGEASFRGRICDKNRTASIEVRPIVDQEVAEAEAERFQNSPIFNS